MPPNTELIRNSHFTTPGWMPVKISKYPKKLPKTEEKFMSLPLVDGNKEQANNKQVNAFKKAMSQFVAKQKLKNG